MGASAGGVEALIKFVSALPPDLDAAAFVCLHVAPYGTSVIPQILSRSGPLSAAHAQDGEPIVNGRIYVAPPDHHLLVHAGAVRVTRGPRENGHRPAVDALFRSAAMHYGSRAAGVVLSGTLDDGTAGLSLIKEAGGVAMVQDLEEALFPNMPRAAMENISVDAVLPAAQIARRLGELAKSANLETTDLAINGQPEDIEAEMDMFIAGGHKRLGSPSGYTCPECHGALFEVHDGGMTRFRCRTGHAFSAQSLMTGQGDALEAALWEALKCLEEKQDLADRMACGARSRSLAQSAQHFETQAYNAAMHAEIIRNVLRQGATATMPELQDDAHSNGQEIITP